MQQIPKEFMNYYIAQNTIFLVVLIFATIIKVVTMKSKYNELIGDGKKNFLLYILNAFNEKAMVFSLKNYMSFYVFSMIINFMLQFFIAFRQVSIDLSSSGIFLQIDYILRVFLFITIMNTLCNVGNYFLKDFTFVAKKAIKRVYLLGILLIIYNILNGNANTYGIVRITSFYDDIAITIVFMMFTFLFHLYSGIKKNTEKIDGIITKWFFSSDFYNKLNLKYEKLWIRKISWLDMLIKVFVWTVSAKYIFDSFITEELSLDNIVNGLTNLLLVSFLEQILQMIRGGWVRVFNYKTTIFDKLNEISNYAIYTDVYERKKNVQPVKVEVDHIIEDEIQGINVINKHLNIVGGKTKPIYKNAIIFLLDTEKPSVEQLQLEVITKYRVYTIFITLIIEFCESELIIQESYFFERARIAKFGWFNWLRITRKMRYRVRFVEESILLKNYYNIYDNELEAAIHKTETNKERFLILNGPYGVGKTLKSILHINKFKKRAVLISPWMEGYKHDILYLIYKKVRSQNKNIINKYMRYLKIQRKENKIFYLFLPVIFLSLYAMKEMIWKLGRDYILNFEPINTFLQNYKMHTAFKYFILLVISYFILASCIGDIIIYLRNSTKYYHDFYIKEIVEAIEKGNIVLVIEDVDRLPVESVREVFTIMSSINNTLAPKVQKCVGILTIDPNNLFEIEMEKDEISELQQKTCFKEIMVMTGENEISNYKKEINKYVKGIALFKWDKKKQKKAKSFRELNHFKVELVKCIREQRKEHEKKINSK